MELAREKPRFGYRRLHVLLGRSGEHVNQKRVHRVYREAGLSIRRKSANTASGWGQPLRKWAAANRVGAGFVDCGQAIRVLSVVDPYIYGIVGQRGRPWRSAATTVRN